MSKTQTQKHTPGPWRIGDAGNTVFGPPNGNPCPEIIANMASRRESEKANARLIAAAPELLAALREVIDGRNFDADGDCVFCGEPEDEQSAHDPHCPIVAARAAIAKAEGSTP